jgi:hypothetical protein
MKRNIWTTRCEKVAEDKKLRIDEDRTNPSRKGKRHRNPELMKIDPNTDCHVHNPVDDNTDTNSPRDITTNTQTKQETQTYLKLDLELNKSRIQTALPIPHQFNTPLLNPTLTTQPRRSGRLLEKRPHTEITQTTIQHTFMDKIASEKESNPKKIILPKLDPLDPKIETILSKFTDKILPIKQKRRKRTPKRKETDSEDTPKKNSKIRFEQSPITLEEITENTPQIELLTTIPEITPEEKPPDITDL